jgi:hypothetical protein
MVSVEIPLMTLPNIHGFLTWLIHGNALACVIVILSCRYLDCSRGLSVRHQGFIHFDVAI